MTPSTNPLIAFLQETLLRLFTKSPAFYKVWQIITGLPVLIIALPETLRIFNIDLPQVFEQRIQTIVAWATTSAFIMSLLSAQSKTVAVDQNGTPVKQTTPEKLPFTTMKEAKAVDKQIKNIDAPPVDQVVLENPVTPKVTK